MTKSVALSNGRAKVGDTVKWSYLDFTTKRFVNGSGKISAIRPLPQKGRFEIELEGGFKCSHSICTLA